VYLDSGADDALRNPVKIFLFCHLSVLRVLGGKQIQIEKRMASFLDEMCKKHADETIVAVTHGGILRVLLWHILGFPYESIFRLRCDNTSINAISSSEGKWIVESWNDTAHLPLEL
jgi:probable phosphoglycerate mutase